MPVEEYRIEYEALPIGAMFELPQISDGAKWRNPWVKLSSASIEEFPVYASSSWVDRRCSSFSQDRLVGEAANMRRRLPISSADRMLRPSVLYRGDIHPYFHADPNPDPLSDDYGDVFDEDPRSRAGNSITVTTFDALPLGVMYEESVEDLEGGSVEERYVKVSEDSSVFSYEMNQLTGSSDGFMNPSQLYREARSYSLSTNRVYTYGEVHPNYSILLENSRRVAEISEEYLTAPIRRDATPTKDQDCEFIVRRLITHNHDMDTLCVILGVDESDLRPVLERLRGKL